jgi:hypothetical protein
MVVSINIIININYNMYDLYMFIRYLVSITFCDRMLKSALTAGPWKLMLNNQTKCGWKYIRTTYGNRIRALLRNRLTCIQYTALKQFMSPLLANDWTKLLILSDKIIIIGPLQSTAGYRLLQLLAILLDLRLLASSSCQPSCANHHSNWPEGVLHYLYRMIKYWLVFFASHTLYVILFYKKILLTRCRTWDEVVLTTIT